MLPTGFQQLVVLALFILPGFVFQAVRSRLRGPTPEDREAITRVLRSLGMSAVLSIFYFILLADRLVWRIREPVNMLLHVERSAVLAFGLIFAVPAFLAALGQVWFIHSREAPYLGPGWWRCVAGVKAWARGWLTCFRWSVFRVYSPIPTAWDYIGPDVSGYVRILTKDGTWLGGYAGPRKFVSAYPESREIFLDRAFSLDENGEFGDEVIDTAGMWINCSEILAIQLFKSPSEPTVVDSGNQAMLGDTASDQSEN